MAPKMLPGAKGADYYFVRFGDRVYVVYDVDLGGGKSLSLTWRIDPGDYKAYGIELGKIRQIGEGAFKALNFMGNVTELQGGPATGGGKHPFEQFIERLESVYGNVSWLRNEQYMKVYLSSWAEGLSTEEIMA